MSKSSKSNKSETCKIYYDSDPAFCQLLHN